MTNLQLGYCYVLTGAPVSRWRACHDDSWDLDMADPTEGKTLGTRRIDGAECTVVLCTDGKVRACLTQNVSVEAP